METLRDEARAWVRAHYGQSARHLMRAEEWLLVLEPHASEELLLATLTHDMERAFPGPDSPLQDTSRGVDDPIYNQAHSERSARIVSDYLREHGMSPERIEHVARLICAHEYGGDAEQNLVQSADSLSFLEVNVDIFLHWMETGSPQWNAGTVRAKFDWMYERIQIPQARELARPFYEDALRKVASKLSSPTTISAGTQQ